MKQYISAIQYKYGEISSKILTPNVDNSVMTSVLLTDFIVVSRSCTYEIVNGNTCHYNQKTD